MLIIQKSLLVQLFSYKMFDQGYVVVVFFYLVLTIFYVPTAYHNLTDGNTP